MTTEGNKALLRRFFEEMDRRKSPPDELLAPNFVAHLPGMPPMDAAGFKQFTGAFYSAFPDLKHTFDDIVAEGDRAAGFAVARGTHRGNFQGIAPTGKQVAITGVGGVRFAGGKLTEMRVIFDAMGLMQQIGAMPAPGQAAPPRR